MTDNSIQLTDKAIKQIKLHTAKQPQLPFLRLGVLGAGCSGYKYLIEYTDQTNEKDLTFEFDGVKVIVDHKSIKLLNGATIDFHNSLMKSEFRIKNDLVKNNCGCGKSFSIR